MSWLEDIILAQSRAGTLPGMFAPGDVMPISNVELAKRYMAAAPQTPPTLDPAMDVGMPADPNAGYAPLVGSPGMPQMSEGYRGPFRPGSLAESLLTPKVDQMAGVSADEAQRSPVAPAGLGMLSKLFSPAAAAPAKPRSTEQPPGPDPISMPPKPADAFSAGAAPFSGPMGFVEPDAFSAGAKPVGGPMGFVSQPPTSLDARDYADDQLPPKATPTSSPARADKPSFFDGFLSRLNDNQGTLMALASGFLGAPSLAQGASRAFAAAGPMAASDRKTALARTTQGATYRALVARGVPAEEALAATLNPDVMKAVAAKYFETKPRTAHKIGSDFMGNDIMGSFDPNTGTFYDAEGRKLGADGAPTDVSSQGGGQAGQGTAATFDPKKINSDLVGEEYLAQFPKEMQSAVKSYVRGESMPVGNPRKGFVQAVKMVAQKYGQDVGAPVDDATYIQRRQYRNQLASANPSSAGGQKNLLGTALGHLADVSKYAKDLENKDWGIPILSHGVNLVRAGMSTAQAAKVQRLNEAVDRFSGEIGRLYSGSQGGGVEERAATRARFGAAKSGPELAGAIEAGKQLLTSRLHALEAQRDSVLGSSVGSDVDFLGDKSREAIAKIEEALANLYGTKAGSDAAPATPRTGPSYPAARRTKTGFTWSVQ